MHPRRQALHEYPRRKVGGLVERKHSGFLARSIDFSGPFEHKHALRSDSRAARGKRQRLGAPGLEFIG